MASISNYSKMYLLCSSSKLNLARTFVFGYQLGHCKVHFDHPCYYRFYGTLTKHGGENLSFSKHYMIRTHEMSTIESDSTSTFSPKIVSKGKEKETENETSEIDTNENNKLNIMTPTSFFKNSKDSKTPGKPFAKPPDQIRKERQLTLIQQLSNLLPSAITGKTVIDKNVVESKAKKLMLAKRNVDAKTVGIVHNLKNAKSKQSKLKRLEELCSHLCEYPEAKRLAVREKVVPTLLKCRNETDQYIQAQAMEALTLCGWLDAVKGKGIRVLSLDGGGTRGLVCIEILKQIQARTGKQIHELFDHVCGVSTGALIGLMVGVFRIELNLAEEIYKEFSREMFQRNFVRGTSRLISSHAYYDTALWENILKENVGWQTFLETSREAECPKVSCVSSLMNFEKIQNYIFRNYTYPPGVNSHYPGSVVHHLWEAIRASSAAPGYYEEFKLLDLVHQDGGVLTNNPAAIAIHESKLLWPQYEIQSVVSIGTGRYEPTDNPIQESVGLKTKLTKIVQSATDTEAVHTILNDLLPHTSYFRFNPYMSEEFTLDEVREDKWEQMQLDAKMYCRKNTVKFDKLAQSLLAPKLPHQKAKEWVREKSCQYCITYY